MPTFETKFRILLSSPSDLEKERAAISEVVDELNKTWGRQTSCSVTLTSQDTVAPSFADEAQGVINDAFGDSWDIYLGLMFARFGSTTRNFGSGTEEEFEKAHNLWKKDKRSRQIMFYFKTGKIDLNKVDAKQLQRVNKFKKSLGKKGGLYKEFKNVEELSGYLRVHLPLVLQKLLKGFSEEKAAASQKEVSLPNPSQSDESGVLDFLDDQQKNGAFTSMFGELNAVMLEAANLFKTEAAGLQLAAQRRDIQGMKHATSNISRELTVFAKRLAKIAATYAVDSTSFFSDVTRFISQTVAVTKPEERADLKKSMQEALEALLSLDEQSKKAQSTLDTWFHLSRELTKSRLLFQSELKGFNAVTEENVIRIRKLLELLG